MNSINTTKLQDLFTNDWKNVLLPLSLNAYWDSLNTILLGRN